MIYSKSKTLFLATQLNTENDLRYTLSRIQRIHIYQLVHRMEPAPLNEWAFFRTHPDLDDYNSGNS